MNTLVTFPPAAPELKLPPRASSEKWAATVIEERRRLQEDQDALREREANLRDYEARLRAWQAEIDAGREGGSGVRTAPVVIVGPRSSSRVPFNEEPALQVAWEKLHRARELLEAEQTHLRDDRITLREQEAEMRKREEALDAREARLAAREELVSVAVAQPVAGEHTMSAVTRLTRAPFEMARSVFGGKR